MVDIDKNAEADIRAIARYGYYMSARQNALIEAQLLEGEVCDLETEVAIMRESIGPTVYTWAHLKDAWEKNPADQRVAAMLQETAFMMNAQFEQLGRLQRQAIENRTRISGVSSTELYLMQQRVGRIVEANVRNLDDRNALLMAVDELVFGNAHSSTQRLIGTDVTPQCKAMDDTIPGAPPQIFNQDVA